MENLFESFSPATKEEWLAKVARDLKGKPLSELHWQLEDTIKMEPFYVPTEVTPIENFPFKSKNNNWEIGEYIDVDNIKKANEQLLEGLNGGVEAPLLRLKRAINQQELELLLASVEPSYISLHFGFYHTDKKPWQLFEHLLALWEAQKQPLEKLKGSLDFDPILDWSTPPFDLLSQTLKTAADQMPNFRVIQVNARRFHYGVKNISQELAFTIAKGSEYLAQLSDQGFAPQTINQHLQFSIAIGTSYFVEIAKIRALKLLWANVLKAYGVAPDQLPPIKVHLAFESQGEDPNTNMIRATTQAMSAVIGGADLLYILPSNVVLKEESTSFSRRIARNVQHILKMESYLDRVIDPAKGSYYIEMLTQKLAEQAWSRFQKIEGDGGFMGLK